MVGPAIDHADNSLVRRKLKSVECSSKDQNTNSYDLVPYESRSFGDSHPRRLQAMCHLFGVVSPVIDDCRVMELGCGNASNLIPMAEELPNANFLGIDLSQKQIAQGQAVVEELGLKNIELRHGSILDVNDDWGQFDYIICHGVYSWVPDDVQDKILEVCRRNLRSNGVALVSYNTFPGWHFRGTVRDIMKFHTSQLDDPRTQVAQARSVLDFLADACDSSAAYGQVLRQELEILSRMNDSYLYHEHLESVNQPVHFYEFAERLAEHRLQYLSESRFGSMLTYDLPERAQNVLDNVSLIEREQYLDFLRNKAFRSSLLCHKEVAIERDVSFERMRALFVSLVLPPEPSDVEIHSDESVIFKVKAAQCRTTAPIVKATFVTLGRLWPRTVAAEELLNHVQATLRIADLKDANESAIEIEEICSILVTMLGANMLHYYRDPPTYVYEVGERPIARPIARTQAARGSHVTTCRHETEPLDDLLCHIVQHLDGSHDRAALVQSVKQAVAGGSILAKGEEIRPYDIDPDDVEAIVDLALESIVRLALLVG